MIRMLTRAGIIATLLAPTLAFAAYNDIVLGGSVIINANSVNLTVVGITASSTTVSGSSFTVDLSHGSSVSISSADRRNLTVTGISSGFVTFACGSSASTLAITSPNDASTVAATVTVESTTCSTGGGGGGIVSSGGGGGGSSVYTPPATTPAVTPPVVAPGIASKLTTMQVQAILSLLASFGADQAVIDNVSASLNGLPSATPIRGSLAKLVRNLDVGSTGDDVKALQVFLNGHGFIVVSSGGGSPGNETSRFGGLTRAALAKFQAANNITPSVGYFGPKTRAKINEILGSQ
ncbi:MAG: peptidoglycan-binding domain-containing protein [bacterium]|nr:peptidoglycan-binding domain-containing protein [bacterium]